MKFAVRKVVALLLAMLMLVSSMASFAEGTVEYSDTVSSYTLNPDTDAADEAIQEVYDEYIAELKAMTSYADRYAWLYSAKNEPASDLGDYFYADFIAYYNEKEPTGDAMCVCAEPLVYGADGHTEGCRWNINNLVTVPGASASSGSASVSGELPAGATLSASSESTPAAFTGLFEADKGAYTDTQYNSYDLKIMVGDQQWQPGSKVAVTLSNVWSGEGTPAVYVYHFIDVASAIDSDCIISYDSALVSAYPEAAAAANEKGYANAVAYEVLSTNDGTATYNAETNSVSFSLDSFSDVVVVSTGMESYYQLLYTFISKEETMQDVYDYLATGKSVGAEEYYNDTYAGFVEWCKVNYPDGITLCNCTTFVYDENGAVIDCPPYQYDTTAHDVTCPWHSDNIGQTSTTISAGNAAVFGNLPAGAKLEVNEITATSAVESFVNKDLFDEGSVSVKVYDIKIKVGDSVWQPTESVKVSLTDAFDTSVSNVYFDVYHIFDSKEAIIKAKSYSITSDPGMIAAFPDAVAAANEAGLGNVIAYTVYNTYNGEVDFIPYDMISFSTDSFSYFVVASGSNSSLDTLTNGESHTVYMVAGRQAKFTVSGSGSITVSGDTSGITSSVSNRTITITTASNVAVNTSNTFTVNWGDGNSASINVIIVESEYASDLNTWKGYLNNDVILAINYGGDVPGEPNYYGTKGYVYYDDNYTSEADKDGIYYADSANGIIDSNIIYHRHFEKATAAQFETVGLPLSSGTDPRDMISGINWNQLLIDISTHDTASMIKVAGTKKEGTNERYTLAELWSIYNTEITKYYEIVCYVIKHENYGWYGACWHIDCVILPKDNVELSYNINVPSGFDMPTGVGVPNTESGIPPAIFTIGSVGGLNNGKMTVKGVDPVTGQNTSYTFTFLRWNTMPDGSGTDYYPNGSIKIYEDTVLYAIWDSDPALGTGNLLIRKVVSSDSNESIDETKSYDFNVVINEETGNPSTGSYDYMVYNADNLSAGISGKIQSGGTISLKHGQYVIIHDLPAINTKEGTENVTVTEVNIPDGYTAKWAGGKTDSNPTTVKITGGRRSELTCTNTAAPKTTTVKVSKVVTGNVGDRSKDFKFTIKVDGKSYTANLTDKSGNIVAADANGYYKFSHEDELTISNLPIGAIIIVTEYQEGYEADVEFNVTKVEGVDTTVAENVAADKTSASATISGVVPGSTITFKNTLDITVDTGILLDSAPYVLLLALVGAGIAFMIIRRRRRED